MYLIITVLLFVSTANGMIQKIDHEKIKSIVYFESTNEYTAIQDGGSRIYAQVYHDPCHGYEYEAVRSFAGYCTDKIEEYSGQEAAAIYKALRDVYGERELQKRRQIEEQGKTEFIQWLSKGLQENRIRIRGGGQSKRAYSVCDDDGKFRHISTVKPKCLSENEFDQILFDLKISEDKRYGHTIVVELASKSLWKSLSFGYCARVSR